MQQVQRNQARAHGSVLILVVAVLVVLALMGTAFIATARLDRKLIEGSGGAIAGIEQVPPTAVQAVESQMITLAQDVQDLIRDDVIDDRGTPADNSDDRWLTGTAEEFDGRAVTPTTNSDNWLAARIPLLAGTPGAWPGVSLPPDAWSTAGAGTPFRAPGNTTPHARGAAGETLQPTSIQINYSAGYAPAYLANQERVFPALDDGSNIRIAGDADGDGIADSQLFPMFSTDIDYGTGLVPVTVFGAIRIVDHGSAVNVDTAFSRLADYDAADVAANPTADPAAWGTLPNKGFFRSNVGLMELGTWSGGPSVITRTADVGPNSEEFALARFRFGDVVPFSVDMFADADDNGTGEAISPGTVQYSTLGEILDLNVARRSAGGFLDAQRNAVRFGTGVDTSLRYHNGMVPPLEANQLERTLFDTAYRSAPNFADDNANRYGYFPADGHDAWFGWHFDNTAAGSRQSNVAADFNTTLTGVSATPAAVSDRPPLRTLLTGNSGESPMPPGITAGGPDFVAAGAGTLASTGKASVNTSDFAELWRAFYGVMVSSANPQAPEATDGPFDPANTMRPASPAIGTWDAYAQLQLRAALPAINAVSLADTDDDVEFETVSMSTGGGATFSVDVFGNEKQPFMTQVHILQSNAAGTIDNFIGIELFNPYPDAIDLNGWQLARYDRATGVPTAIFTFGAGTTIPAEDFLVLTSNEASFVAAGVLGTTIDISSGNAELVLALADGQEIMLLRPDGTGGFMPIDQVDMYGVAAQSAAIDTIIEVKYAREATPDGWEFVYPGTYDSAAVSPAFRMEWDTGNVSAVPADLPIAAVTGLASIGLADLGDGAETTVASSPAFQLHNMRSESVFNYGGFPRDGDMLHIPFAGAYIVRDNGGTVVEVNSLPMDLALTMADPATPPDAALGEPFALGRFLPYDGTGAALSGFSWADDLFDHVTAQLNPRSDRKPNVQSSATLPTVELTDNDGSNVQGRINLNTAPLEVLEMLPLAVDPATGLIDAARTRTIAEAIVTHRNTTGPFTSLFDLMLVPAVVTMDGQIPAALGTPANAENVGKLSATNDPTGGDFESAYLNLTRLSNLATVRSDVFTVYVLVQAWQYPDNAAASAQPPAMLYEERRAFIVDRSVLGDDPTAPIRVTPLLVGE